ncbi:alternate-type signal peptide domain-containing protein [Herbiconiux sp. P15]|uniref:alternate-type signal peptide domain-containing protein n=1 Tax=Herbiconiux liukaitaii TaxID=3342799 RepID=UPI0035B89DAD
MNAVTKGAIAAGAAVVLLTSGLGTLAFWSSSASVADGTLSSGYLSLSVQNPLWYDISEGDAQPFDPAVDTIVPGDVILYTADAVVAGEGRNLEATLLADTADLGGDLLPYIDVSMSVDDIVTSELSYDLGPIEEDRALPIELVFTFDPDTPSGEGMDADLNLTDFELTLVQNP